MPKAARLAAGAISPRVVVRSRRRRDLRSDALSYPGCNPRHRAEYVAELLSQSTKRVSTAPLDQIPHGAFRLGYRHRESSTLGDGAAASRPVGNAR
jgi:hypothetical protein